MRMAPKGTPNSALVGDRIKNVNRSAMARDTGISLSGVSRILSGNRGASSKNLRIIAGYLEVTMDDLDFYLRKRRAKIAKRFGRTAA